jgi:beta-RFAP synthase
LGDCAPVDLASICDRARRSAIGLWGFAWGGFLVDAGQRHAGTPGDVAARIDFPETWRVLLIQPPAGEAIYGCREESRMSKLAPMRPERTGELCRLALTEILPALRGRDLQAFREGLQHYGDLVGDYFAHVQEGRYSHPQSSAVVENLRAMDVTGVVQSSWGPTLCAFFEDADAAAQAGATLAALYPEMTFTVAAGRNYGADVELC